MTWNAINGGLIMAWITAFNNSLIHVFMYWYYFKQTLGIDVWWKKYLTTGQIIQVFIIIINNYILIIYLYYGKWVVCINFMICSLLLILAQQCPLYTFGTFKHLAGTYYLFIIYIFFLFMFIHLFFYLLFL